MLAQRTIVPAIAAMLVVAASAQAGDNVSPREAQRAIHSMEKANSSLTKAIQAAEERTGGKAYSAELLAQDEVTDIYNRSGYSRHDANGDAKTAEQDTKSSKESTDNAADATHNSEQDAENEQLAKQDSRIDTQAAHARVNCLLNGNRMRSAIVNLTTNKVVRVRNIGHGDSGMRYGFRDDYGYNRDYYNSQYNQSTNRYTSSYNSNNDMRERDDSDGDNVQVNRAYIEQNAWPPSRGERGYRAIGYESNYQANNNNNQYDNTNEQDDRGSSAMNRRASGLVLASDLMNANVRNLRGEDIGDLSDLAIDPNSKCLVYASVTHGGFLGLGQKRFAIPPEELTLSNDGSVRIDARVEEFKEREGFKADNWPKQADSYWSTGSSNYVANSDPSNVATEIVKSSDIIDRDVFDNAGHEIGEVEDLIVDPTRGKVAYLLVEVGEGTDEGLVAVPAAAVEHQQDKCVVNCNRSSIESMEHFTADNYPNFNSMRWNERMHAAFNVDPYWQDNGQRLSSSRSTQTGG